MSKKEIKEMNTVDKYRKIKLQHFKNLVAVAVADGFWHENEKKLLSVRAEQFGLTTKEITSVLDEAEDLKFTIPENIIDREEQLQDAVFMSMIDGLFHPKEYRLCISIANRLGFSKRSVDQALKMMKK